MREPLYKSRRVAPDAARFGATRINDFILQCEAFSNSYLLETAEGNIQVNAGMGLEAPVIARSFAEHTREPLRYLILTQGHVDHVGGVQYFRDQHPGLCVLAQAGNPEHQAYDGRLAEFRAARSAFAFAHKFGEVMAYYEAQGYRDYPAQDAPVPDVLVRESHTLALGGLKLELLAVPGAETNDSLIVWLPQQRICLTGNLFGCPFGHFPNLFTIRGDRYRDPLVVAAAVQRVLDLEPEMILYGHHEPVTGAGVIREELTVLRDAILYVHDATVAGMNAGADVYSLMRDIHLPPELEVGQGYGRVDWGVRAIWEYYAGWFKHRSTTELYGLDPDSINADLLALAGMPALVDRAGQRLREGQPVAALALLDIVLHQSDYGPALELAVAAHRELLRESDNFWLDSWLRAQLAQLEERLAGIAPDGEESL